MGKFLGFKRPKFNHLAPFLFLFSLLSPVGAQASIALIPPVPGIPWVKQHASEHALVTCGQAYSISKWAHMRFGGPKPPTFTSQQFAGRVADALLDKWDPYRVLHTQADARALSRDIKAHWDQFAQARSCLALSRTIENHLNRLEKRLVALTQKVDPKTVLPARMRAKERSGDSQLYRYESFATNAQKLQHRMDAEIKISLADLTTTWWEAFDKDAKKLIDSVVQNRFAIDSDKSSPHWLLLGTLAALDPYSTYLTDPEFEDLTRDLSGVASGVGIRVRTIPAGLLIRHVLEDSPAGRSGELQAGDWIVEVNGKSLKALTDRHKHDSLRGNAGETLALKIRRAGRERLVQLKREEINLEDAKVSYHLFPLRQGEGDVAILRIPSFYGESGWNYHGENKSCALDVENALNEILSSKRKVAAIVLDLRGNPGGFLEEAVSMAGLFLGNQPVVGVAQGEQVKILRNYHRKPLYSGPLVVALDPDSASASEVLAGALSDNGRAVVVAESHTYGKGSVQRLFPLKELTDGELPLSSTLKVGAVKLTTSLFFSPKGVSPEGAGVQAHIRVGDKKSHSAKAYRLKKVYEAALAAMDKNDKLAPVVTETTIRSLESKSRTRDKETQESLGKALSKVLRTDTQTEVSPALIEAVAVARDFNAPAVAVKN